METKNDIEGNVDAALETAKKINPVELTPGFSEKVISAYKHQQSGNGYQLLKVAAMFILIIANAWTLRLFFTPQPNYQPSTISYQPSAISDFVNGYQVNDVNDEFLTINTTKHEQR